MVALATTVPAALTTRSATLAPATGTGVSLARVKDAVTGAVAVVVVPATHRTAETPARPSAAS